MTKQTIKNNLLDVEKLLNMEYHDYIKYYNDNVFPVGQMNTDYYTIFKSQRQLCTGIIKNILREL